MNLLAVINQLISLFLMMLAGFVAARAGVITPDFRKKLSTFTLSTAAPGVVISSVLTSDSNPLKMLGALGMSVFFFALVSLFAAVIVRVFRVRREEAGLDQLMLIFTNVGFMGIPVVQSIYGAQGVALVSMFILIFNLYCFSYGVLLISSGAKFNWKSLCNPCIIAAIIAFILALTGWHFPAPVENTLSSVGSMNTPLAMMIIGASMAHSDIRKALSNPRMYFICLLSMFLMPVLVLLVIMFLPIDPMLAGVTVLMAAMPIGGNCAMLSDQYTPDDMTASHCVMVSTLLSAVSLPIVCALISLAL